MFAERHVVDVTTDASGDATVYSPVVNGRILNVIYTKDGTTPFDAGVDFTITGEVSGLGIWTESNVNASKTVAPRQPLHDQVGAAMLFASGGEALAGPIVLAEERVKIVVAQGGNAKDGQFIIVVG